MRKVVFGLLVLVVSVAVFAVACGGQKTITGKVGIVEHTTEYHQFTEWSINDVPVTLLTILALDGAKIYHLVIVGAQDNNLRPGYDVSFIVGDTIGKEKTTKTTTVKYTDGGTKVITEEVEISWKKVVSYTIIEDYK